MEGLSEYQQEVLEKEFQKLEDLEFEYHILEANCVDKLQVAVAKAKYNNQLKHFENLVDNIEEIK